MSLTRKDIENIARLARLELAETEIPVYVDSLSKVPGRPALPLLLPTLIQLLLSLGLASAGAQHPAARHQVPQRNYGNRCLLSRRCQGDKLTALIGLRGW